MRSVEERHTILRACHMDPTSGHMGVKRTAYRIGERFYWKGMMKDVELVVSFVSIISILKLHFFGVCIQVSNCDLCQRNNSKLCILRPELHPVAVHSPWFHVAIDFVGPISPASTLGNRYILTLSDYFTKWVEAVPLPSKEATEVASTLFKARALHGCIITCIAFVISRFS